MLFSKIFFHLWEKTQKKFFVVKNSKIFVVKKSETATVQKKLKKFFVVKKIRNYHGEKMPCFKIAMWYSPITQIGKKNVSPKKV